MIFFVVIVVVFVFVIVVTRSSAFSSNVSSSSRLLLLLSVVVVVVVVVFLANKEAFGRQSKILTVLDFSKALDEGSKCARDLDGIPLQGYQELVPPHQTWCGRCTTCAVVVPSGHLINSSAGKRIDSHECVFRLNGAPVKGFSQDVGSKTDFQILSHSSFPLRSPSAFERLVQSSLPNFVFIWGLKFNRRKEIFRETIKTCALFETTRCFASESWLEFQLDDEFERETGLNRVKSGSWLSTGWFALSITKSLCSSTSIFGMTPPDHCSTKKDKKQIPYHYYGSIKKDECSYFLQLKDEKKDAHRFFLEKKTFGLWAQKFNFSFFAPSWDEERKID